MSINSQPQSLNAHGTLTQVCALGSQSLRMIDLQAHPYVKHSEFADKTEARVAEALEVWSRDALNMMAFGTDPHDVISTTIDVSRGANAKPWAIVLRRAATAMAVSEALGAAPTGTIPGTDLLARLAAECEATGLMLLCDSLASEKAKAHFGIVRLIDWSEKALTRTLDYPFNDIHNTHAYRSLQATVASGSQANTAAGTQLNRINECVARGFV